MTRETERQWLNYGLIAGFLLTIIVLIWTRRTPVTPISGQTDAPTRATIYLDTNRIKLRHRDEQAAAEVEIIRQHLDPLLTDYENAYHQYDTVRIVLPEFPDH